MLDDPEMIRRKFKRAVTDSENEVRYDPAEKPGVSNLLDILGAATDQAPADLAKGYTQYGPLKADAADAVVELLAPIQVALPRAARRPRRADVAAARRARRRPARWRRRRCSGPTTRSASCRRDVGPPSARGERHRPADRRPRAAGARQPRRRAAVRPRRHGDRRPPRHGPARRAGAGGDGPRPRRRGVQLPDLRHDRARRPPHRRRPTAARRADVGRADAVAVGDRRASPSRR